MPPPSIPVLRELYRLDASSQDYGSQLIKVLVGEEYTSNVSSLSVDDLINLADYLDEAIDTLKYPSADAQQCLRELRRICGNNNTLPASYAPPPHLAIDPEPVKSDAYSDVYKAVSDNRDFGVRRIRVHQDPLHQISIGAICEAAVVWKHLNHPNILTLLWVTLDPLQLVTIWMPGGELCTYIKTHPDADRVELLSDIITGLSYLHSCDVIHGDLRGANILVDDSGHARISDYGFAIIAREAEPLGALSDDPGNTQRWRAPEVRNGREHSKEADVFSFAMVTYEVFSGQIPFSDKGDRVALALLNQGERPQRPNHPALTDRLWEMMQSCWDQDPHSRPTASEIVRVVCASSDQEYVPNLQGEDLTWVVNLLDEVISGLNPSTAASKKCLSKLKAICGLKVVLPKSYLLSSRSLRIGTDAFASGGYGDIYRATLGISEVRVKRVRIPHPKYLQAAEKAFCEGAIMWKHLEHPNIVPLRGFTIAPLQIVSGWMPNGNLPDYIKRYPRADIIRLLSEVAKGLCYLHSRDVVHMELKGSNVLVDADRCARISDFGLATVTSRDNFAMAPHQPEYSPRWSAPEVLSEKAYSKPADVFSFAMLMIEVFSGAEPLSDLAGFNAALAIIQGTRPVRPKNRVVTGRLWKLIQQCWNQDPQLRPEASEILRVLLTPWYYRFFLLQ